MMSCEHDAKVKFEVFLDRTPVCNPQYSHEASDEASTECCAIQMEHSYSRDTRPTDSKAMATRSILVHKPPPCPSCHQNPTSPCEDMDVDMGDDPDTYPPVPKYNDKAAKEAMESIASIAAKTKNRNSEDDDWEEYIDKLGWSIYQHTLFSKVSDVLTADRLTRLTYANHPQEAILRRTNINKSVQGMRKAFAEVHWDTKLTQWLHGLLVDHMPISYVAAYMDILQTLRTKVPTLVDKMLQGKPTDLTEAVMRPPWKPQVEVKDRKITPEPIILVCPSNLPTHTVSTDSRESQWTTLLLSMTSHVLNVPIPENFYLENGTCPLADYVEQLVTLTRVKLHDIRKEHPQRQIILFGVNAGSSLALQVASLEQNINCVICMGFATSTMKGTRGNLDDRLVELQTPVLFVVGQNSAKTSQEQMEALREQMVAPTALVVVGSADDYLLVPNAKQRLEKVTQEMVDHMVMDEVAEFTSNCISNPPVATKKRLPVNSSATIVILDSPTDSVKTNGGQLGVKKNPKSPVKISRVTKKKIMERAGGTVGKFVQYGSKKEFTDKIALTSSSGQLTNYEIVTGKMKPTTQVLDGSIIQIANDSQQPQKWQVTTSAAPVSRTPVLVPLLQKQKISLGNHFTPMRTSTATDSQLMGVTKPFQVNVKGKKMYSLQATEVTETIELDTDDEIVNLDGATVVDGDVLNATVAELSAGDLSGIPVVFQDSEGNIREPVGSSNPVVVDVGSAPVQNSGTVIVTSQSVIPRPNKYVYYKPQQTSRVQQQSQYVVLSNGGSNDDKMKIVTSTASTGQNVSSKPLIISVESLEKGTPNTVYHVLPDAAEKEE